MAVGADIGLAFDGDADRMFLVDETARPVSGSLTTAIIARSILDRGPGAIIIHNLILLPDRARGDRRGAWDCGANPGGPLLHQARAMAETGAVFGGEHSGHYYFRGQLPCRQRAHRRFGGA